MGMHIIGVIDLRGGVAVHARGGTREAYAPVRAAAGVPIDGDAIALGRAYVERLGVRELYVADLDAIERGLGAMNASILADLASLGARMMVDAGVSAAADGHTVLGAGASTVVIGLETLTSFDALDEIAEALGGERVAFSIDLRDGVCVARPNVLQEVGAGTASDVATRAAAAGASTVIVLDLARVGTGAGIDLDLMRVVRLSAPRVRLLAGGGVRDGRDLHALAEAGCDGALVATALLGGGLNV